jgi:TolB protein
MKRPKRRWVAALMLAILVTTVQGAGAVVTGSIFGPGSQSFPIAVPTLKNLGGDQNAALGQRFAAVLSRDLDLSGYFRVLDPKTFIEDPQSSGLSAGETDFVGWAAIGAQAVVKGGITVTGDTVSVEFRLFDVPGRSEVPQVAKRYSGSRADLPRMAHKAADGILEFLTGERGPFDSTVALVSTGGARLKDVYRYTFDMDAPARVTDERSIVVTPRWKPDGRALLFTSYRQHQPKLFQVTLASRQVTLLVGGPGMVLDGAWSPDGSRLAITRDVGGNSEIFVTDAAGQSGRRLTDHWGIDVSPVWSPDGRRIAFCSARSGGPQIYVMTSDGSGVTRVSQTGNYNTSPAWSPKGDRLAWTTRTGGIFQVVVASDDGSDARTITSQGSNENPTWGPDGRYLVFSSRRGGRSHLYFADRDGKTLKQLTRGPGDDTSPAWSPRQ